MYAINNSLFKILRTNSVIDTLIINVQLLCRFDIDLIDSYINYVRRKICHINAVVCFVIAIHE